MHRLEQFQSVPGMSLSLQTYNFSHGRFLTLIGSLIDQRLVFLIHIKQALTVCDDLGVSVLIGGFEIIRPFPLVGVNGKEQLDLLLFVFEVVVLVGDNSHDLRFIKKSGQLLAVRLLRIA